MLREWEFWQSPEPDFWISNISQHGPGEGQTDRKHSILLLQNVSSSNVLQYAIAIAG
jgi:hypothetical protein